MEFILTLLLIIFIIPALIVRLLPYILKFWVNKKMKQASRNMETNDFKNKQKVGDVYVSSKIVDEQDHKSEKIVTEDMGEYVEFETIKEDKDGDI